MPVPRKSRRNPRASRLVYRRTRDDQGIIASKGLHRGKGTVGVKWIFGRQGYARPALLYTYTIPPGASEGAHTHARGDRREGSYDEFYFVVAGRGIMEIAGRKLAVRSGDHVYVPNGVSRGIENTSRKPLRVYLVAVARA